MLAVDSQGCSARQLKAVCATSAVACCGRKKEEMRKKLSEKVEELMEDFQEQWEPVMENLETAEKAFDNLDGALPRLPVRHALADSIKCPFSL